MGEILLERSGGLALVTIAQPERLNALTYGMWKELARVVSEAGRDRSVRVAVLRGAGTDAFSAGADISEFPLHRSTPLGAERYSTAVSLALDALAEIRKPTLAVLRGVCAGGGAGIALSCSLRFADDRLRFSIPAARLGVVYEVEAIAQLVRAVGPSYAFDILISGRTIDSEEALRIGLVNRVAVCAELDELAMEYAERICTNAPIPMEGAWVAIRATQEPWEQRWHEELEDLKRQAIESADFAEGVRAFLDKRPPVFRGR